ncbi:hypothetical protein ACFOLF_25025 [Paenibacillus sepulcri]|uniref:hypothetical protein n=1 Tax=Paenibacillus sepulcri TaxID=359917 RepID=UPI0035EFB43C
MTSEIELRAAVKDAEYIRSIWKGVNLQTFALEDIPYGLFKLGLDLFHDGSLYLVHTPGHSKGHISVLIRTGEGWVLLASDTGYAEKSWKQHILPGLTTSKNEAAQSLRWIAEFAQIADCCAVLANHEGNVISRIIG